MSLGEFVDFEAVSLGVIEDGQLLVSQILALFGNADVGDRLRDAAPECLLKSS